MGILYKIFNAENQTCELCNKNKGKYIMIVERTKNSLTPTGTEKNFKIVCEACKKSYDEEFNNKRSNSDKNYYESNNDFRLK